MYNKREGGGGVLCIKGLSKSQLEQAGLQCIVSKHHSHCDSSLLLFMTLH